MRTVIFAIAAGAAFAAAGASAQERDARPPLRLTLDEAVTRGLESSHRVAESIARGDMADAVVGQRRASTLPQFAALGGYTRTNHVDPYGIVLPTGQATVLYPDVPDNFRVRLDAQWPIYTGGRLEAIERAARIDATASADEVASVRGDLKLEITRAFWALLTARESLRVVEASASRVEAHLADVRNQLTAGLVPPSDVYSVEAQASRQRMLTVQARSTRDVMEAELARLVGAPPGTAIEPAAALEALAPPPGPIDGLVDAALKQRPERAVLLKRTDAAGERAKAAAAGTKPTVAVAGGFDRASPNPRIFPRIDEWRSSWDASVNVSMPIFDGGKARGEMAEAAALTRSVRERLADFDATVVTEVRQRASEVVASRAAIDAATDAVRSAAEARRVLGERFNAGVATSTDVLDAQVALLQAELDRTQAIAAAHLADARLARALGQ
jgi:outer membrane protein TolC